MHVSQPVHEPGRNSDVPGASFDEADDWSRAIASLFVFSSPPLVLLHGSVTGTCASKPRHGNGLDGW